MVLLSLKYWKTSFTAGENKTEVCIHTIFVLYWSCSYQVSFGAPGTLQKQNEKAVHSPVYFEVSFSVLPIIKCLYKLNVSTSVLKKEGGGKGDKEGSFCLEIKQIV